MANSNNIWKVNCLVFVYVKGSYSHAVYSVLQRSCFENFKNSQETNIKWAIPEKIQIGGLRIYFYENPPVIFHFLLYPVEIPDKTKLNPWIFHETVWDSLEISRPKRKTPRNSTLFFLGHPWKFHFVFN